MNLLISTHWPCTNVSFPSQPHWNPMGLVSLRSHVLFPHGSASQGCISSSQTVPEEGK